MNHFKYINYDKCITNLIGSIAKHFNVTPFHSSLKEIDDILSNQQYKNIVMMVFDGRGSYILKKNIAESSFIMQNKLMDIHCVYPSTTVACTTSFLSGLNPIESGWLGWSLYIKPVNETVDIFSNVESYSKKAIAENCASFIPYKEIGTIIQETNNDVEYHTIMPSFKENGYSSLNEGMKRLIDLCNTPKRKYIYFYCDEPDATMHLNSVDGPYAKNQIQQINDALLTLKNTCPESLFIVSADHGQINVNSIALYTYYDLMATFRQAPSLDGRTTAFFIKEGQDEKFIQLFKKYFHDKFLLLSKKEVLEKNIFGTGIRNELADDILGDYISFAIDKYYFRIYDNSHYFKGHHAGLLRDEMIIPLIIFRNK